MVGAARAAGSLWTRWRERSRAVPIAEPPIVEDGRVRRSAWHHTRYLASIVHPDRGRRHRRLQRRRRAGHPGPGRQRQGRARRDGRQRPRHRNWRGCSPACPTPRSATSRRRRQGDREGRSPRSPRAARPRRRRRPRTSGKVLEDKGVTAVAIAAPDHWHAPAAIMACAAGKDVYVEKPCGHNPREGELLVAAARSHNRIVQMGSQRRSWPTSRTLTRQIRDGSLIGRVYFARGWYVNTRASIGVGKPAPVPAGLDYELWQGPAPAARVQGQRHPLQLALVLELGHQRSLQQRHARDRRDALGHGRHVPDDGRVRSAAATTSRTTGSAPTRRRRRSSSRATSRSSGKAAAATAT